MQPVLIKYCRLFCNLSQKQLSELIGIDQSYISKIEAGVIPITTETEQRLLKVFAGMGMDSEAIVKVKQVLNEIQKG